MPGRVKLDNTLLTCNQGNFNQITARRQNRTLFTAVRDTCTIAVPPVPPHKHQHLPLTVLLAGLKSMTVFNVIFVSKHSP